MVILSSRHHFHISYEYCSSRKIIIIIVARVGGDGVGAGGGGAAAAALVRVGMSRDDGPFKRAPYGLPCYFGLLLPSPMLLS